MKKTIGFFCLLLLNQITFGQTNSKIAAYTEQVWYNTDGRLNFIKLAESQRIDQSEVISFINEKILNDGTNKVSVKKTELDQLGFTHIKFDIFQSGILLANKMIIAHCQNGKLVSLNGDLSEPSVAVNTFALGEKQALTYALNKVQAKKYKWENKAEEQHMREALNDPSFSYYPHATKVAFEKNGEYYKAFQFNIYAEEPLYRANVLVNASTGEILDEQNLICTADVPATALTKYSGTQTITVDLTSSVYRLKEVQRGLGIETYNLSGSNLYQAATNFTNATSNWTTTGFDQAATDAHWGAEKTYDYYLNQHNRNSINNNGFKLLSYVHYQTNYANAFWDGQRMTYGDGNGGSTTVFTALDVCGHEITHGLTSNTGNLLYSYESGALNESFSDIFGTAIENYGRPGNWNWKIGEDLTTNGLGLRDMSNPNAYTDPDTYGGSFYTTSAADNGGVHTNSGVSNYWFYLLTAGGTGTNDISNPYTVNGIGINDAARIAFRALTFYFTPSTNYAAARALTIQSAKDLFGNCSNEVIQTTRAWYAVGVGANYIPGLVGPNFIAYTTDFCSVPASVNFNNTTVNGITYTWDFGDGSTATSVNAVHTYTAVGVYSVKLKATGCTLPDSITKSAYIVVNGPVASPVTSGTTVCENAMAILNASGNSTIKWYENSSGGAEIGTGSPFTTPTITNTSTFYAANTLTVAPVFGGMASGTGGGYSNNASQWLVFDVLQSGGVLNSVVVYAQSVGNRVIQLRSSANVVINSATVNLSIGANTVTLDFPLAPGANYRLGLGGTLSGLYRSFNGITYPYNIGGCVSINTSNTGGNMYYFFYNWKVTKNGCASPRVAALVSVNPAPVVNIGAPANACMGDQVTLMGMPAGGTFSGNGVSGSVFNSIASGVGTHTLTYTFTDNNSCSNTSDATVIVQECTGLTSDPALENSVSVYPNPAKDSFIIKTIESGLKFTLTDISGRTIVQSDINSSSKKIEMNGFANGVYIISIRNANGKTIKTLKLIKE